MGCFQSQSHMQEGASLGTVPKQLPATQAYATPQQPATTQGIQGWLDELQIGWGMKYARAFETLGIDNVSFLPDMDEKEHKELEEALKMQEIKPMHLKKIMKAVVDVSLQGADDMQYTRDLSSVTQNTAVCMSPSATDTQYSAFLSHYKIECATEARICHMELSKMLDGPVFLDSDYLHDLRTLRTSVINSKALVLFQSKSVLTRPWCLLELHTAIEYNVPIVALHIVNRQAQYDHEEAARFLMHLDVELKRVNPDAPKLLSGHGVDLEDLAYRLSDILPNIISIPFDPMLSASHLQATLSDLANAIKKATPQTDMSKTKEEWSAQRACERAKMSDPELNADGKSKIPNGSDVWIKLAKTLLEEPRSPEMVRLKDEPSRADDEGRSPEVVCLKDEPGCTDGEGKQLHIASIVNLDGTFREASQAPYKSDEVHSIVRKASLNSEATDVVSECVPLERISKVKSGPSHPPVEEGPTEVVDIQPNGDASASLSGPTARDAATNAQIVKEITPTQNKADNRQWGCLSYCRAEEADTELQFESDDGESR